MNRVIMLEGLPGTGKTTNSYRLFEQLSRNGRNVRWLHEVSRPHPVLFFSEACMTKEEYHLFTEKYPEIAETIRGIAEVRNSTVGIDYLTASGMLPGQENAAWYQELMRHDAFGVSLDRYEPIALDKWEAFVNAALQDGDTVYILDSSIFQYQIFTYLLAGAEYARMAGLVRRIMKMLKPLNPLLIWLYREKTEDSIAFLEQQRGPEDLQSTWERDRDQPYYRNKQNDVTAFHDFLKDYADYASRLFDESECNKLRIEITAQNWSEYEDRMLRFLGLEHRDAPSCKAKNGTYVNAAHGFSFTVADGVMTDPEGTRRKLSPKNSVEFFIENLPETLHFSGEDSAEFRGQPIIPEWSENGLVYQRKKDN